MQDYQREEITPEEPKDFVEPRHLTVPTQRKKVLSSPEPEELTDIEVPKAEEIQNFIGKKIDKIEIPTLDQCKEKNVEKYILDINRRIYNESKNPELFKKILKELKREHGLDDSFKDYKGVKSTKH